MHNICFVRTQCIELYILKWIIGYKIKIMIYFFFMINQMLLENIIYITIPTLTLLRITISLG